MICAQGEPVYSLSRLRTGLSISRENLGLICGGKLRMDPVSSVLGQHSVTERTVLELYPGAGQTELIARTKALESDRSDEELMELYCSAAYFGNGIYGADNGGFLLLREEAGRPPRQTKRRSSRRYALPKS